MDKIVAYCGTRNLYPVMETAAKSLLYNTYIDNVYFFIEDDVFPTALPGVISTVNVSDQQWFDRNGPNYNTSWTYMAYTRLVITKILPDCHRILYLDTDTIVMQDISPVFEANLNGKLFGMVREDLHELQLEICNAFVDHGNALTHFQSDSARPAYCTHPYYNSGVMLMNLDELRVTGMDDAIIHEINTVSYPYPDQDAINLLCKNRIFPLPTEYNVISAISPDFPLDQIRIKHYASDKPLWKSSLWQRYKRMSWESIMERQAKLIG